MGLFYFIIMENIQETKYKSPIIQLRLVKETNIQEATLINDSSKAYHLMKSLFNTETIEIYEEMHIAYLNRSNKVIGTYMMSKGGTTGTIADIKLITCIAIKTLASGVILAHNHPSGSLKPSTEDLVITKKLIESLKMFDIKLIDHLIITQKDEHYSFCDMGDI